MTRPRIGKNRFHGYYAGLDLQGQRLILGKAAAGQWQLLATAPFEVNARLRIA
ncbi:MAG: hypothetical protein GX493_03915 [Firmicutes bacterium]|nr:hypothetical protein [Bacillota bacterium]